MKRFKFTQLPIYGLILGCFACTDFFMQPVDSEALLDTSEKVVVNCILHPDADTILAQVVWSSSVLEGGYVWEEQDYTPITNAKVEMSNGARTVTLKYLPHRQQYGIAQSDFPLAEGRYSIVVKTDSHEAKASCTMPAANTTLQAVLTEEMAEWGLMELYVNASWKVIPDARYYSLSYRSRYNYDDNQVSSLTGCQFLGITEPPSGQYKEKHYVWILDEDDAFGELYLLSLDNHLYEYRKSVCTLSESPFSEPAVHYTNIEGGVGVFGAYNFYMIEVRR